MNLKWKRKDNWSYIDTDAAAAAAATPAAAAGAPPAAAAASVSIEFQFWFNFVLSLLSKIQVFFLGVVNKDHWKHFLNGVSLF